MSDRLITKQRTHAEEKKLGRVEHFCEFDQKTKGFHSGTRATDAAKKPRMVVAFEYPVGRSRGVQKP